MRVIPIFLKKSCILETLNLLIDANSSPILALLPSTRSLHDLRKRIFWNVTDLQTNRQTDRHRDYMTELDKWADSVKILFCVFVAATILDHMPV